MNVINFGTHYLRKYFGMSYLLFIPLFSCKLICEIINLLLADDFITIALPLSCMFRDMLKELHVTVVTVDSGNYSHNIHFPFIACFCKKTVICWLV